MPRHERDLIGIIEDDVVMGGTLTHRLELEGYRPLWWRTGQDALEALSTSDPELVVCDIKLPDMSGEEVFLRALPRLGAKPFFFITAFGEFDQAVRLTKAGGVDYIAKPFAVSDLLERIARVLSVRPKANGLLGESQAMRRIEILLRRVANIDSSLLLTGESGGSAFPFAGGRAGGSSKLVPNPRRGPHLCRAASHSHGSGGRRWPGRGCSQAARYLAFNAV
jgi:DNA-binding NtrC family response regulator